MVEVEAGGVARRCSAIACPEARPGDRVLTHANLVISVLSEAEAAEIEMALAELARLAPPGAVATR